MKIQHGGAFAEQLIPKKATPTAGIPRERVRVRKLPFHSAAIIAQFPFRARVAKNRDNYPLGEQYVNETSAGTFMVKTMTLSARLTGEESSNTHSDKLVVFRALRLTEDMIHDFYRGKVPPKASLYRPPRIFVTP